MDTVRGPLPICTHSTVTAGDTTESIDHAAQKNRMTYRRLADIPWLGRALGGRGEPLETPFAGGMEGRDALRRCSVFMGNFVLSEAPFNAAKQHDGFRNNKPARRAYGNWRTEYYQAIINNEELKFCETHWTNRRSRQIRCQQCSYGRNRQLGSQLCPGGELP